ncbi:ribokinase [Fastidiosibacter lacustris]|uniref:ribokinase n=1 Tax=Fastidiosibacter lacustris TaxID=2056695 RepID=UPI000E34E6E7|nr:ribokinase [Fastidiosibacter lacustris]
MTIMVIGSANTDLIIQVEHLPRPGETLLGGKFLTASGGKGANQAVAAARLGGKVCFIASIGQDSFGEALLKKYAQDSINIQHIKRPQSASGIAMVCVASNGQNSIVVAPGSNAFLTPCDIAAIEDQFLHAKVVLTQLEIPLSTIVAAAKLAYKHKCLFILNPAPAYVLPDELYPFIDIITPNEIEAELLTGIRVCDLSSALTASKILHQRGIKNVIITMGHQGAFFYDGKNEVLVPTLQVNAIDTTAAGDTFNGALAKTLCNSNDIISAIKYANKASALSVTKLGAQSSIPYPHEIEALQG